MDFAFLPPEVNSGRIYDGPGSGPMLAAVAAWDGLATELHSAATSYESVISDLSAGPWLGAASAAMTAAAGSFVAWMQSTATQAEQTAVQAKAAAAASQLTSTAVQGLAATAATNATSEAAQGTLPDFEANVLFLPGVAQAGLTPLNTTALFVDLQADDSELRDDATHAEEREIKDMLVTLGRSGGRPVELAPEVAAPSMMPGLATALGPAEVPSVMSGLGRAPVIGGLSVPPGWTVAAPEIRLAALTLPATSLGAAPEVMAASPGSLFSEMTLANMASRAMAGTTARGCQERTGSISRPRPVSTPTSPSGHGKTIAADVHEFAAALVKLGDLRDSGLLTDEEFTEQKERLLAN